MKKFALMLAAIVCVCLCTSQAKATFPVGTVPFQALNADGSVTTFDPVTGLAVRSFPQVGFSQFGAVGFNRGFVIGNRFNRGFVTPFGFNARFNRGFVVTPFGLRRFR